MHGVDAGTHCQSPGILKLDAYDRMQPAYDHMQAAFYDRMQAACVPSVAPALRTRSTN